MEEEIDIREYLKLIKGKIRVIVGIVFLFVLVITMFQVNRQPVYQTYSYLNIGKVEGNLLESPYKIEVEILSGATLALLGKEVGKTKEEVKELIKFKENDDLLKIITRDYKPKIALRLNEVIGSYIVARHREIVSAKLEAYKKSIEEKKAVFNRLEETIERLKNSVTKLDVLKLETFLSNYAEVKIDLIDEELKTVNLISPTKLYTIAQLPGKPIPQHKIRNILLSIVVGFIFSIFFIVTWNYIKGI